MTRARVVVSLVALSSFCLAFCLQVSAATLTVGDGGGADYTDIQSALDAAQDGDTVLVKPGEYVVAEPLDFNKDRSLLGRGALDPGNPESPPVKNLVLQSEGGAAVTTIRMSDTPLDPDRASVVLFHSGESAASVLDGFTIKGGRGTKFLDDPNGDWGELWGFRGGGILCVGATSPTLVHCTVRENHLPGRSGACGNGWLFDPGHGAGLAVMEASSPTVLECTFEENATGNCGAGGGVYVEAASLSLTGCVARANHAIGGGGGLHLGVGSTVTVEGSTFSGNSGSYGAAVSADAGSSLIMKRSTVSGNEAVEVYYECGDCVDDCEQSYGGGIGSSGLLTLEDCTISQNTAHHNAGMALSGTATVTRCTISDNVALAWPGFRLNRDTLGGGVTCGPGQTFTDCRIVANIGGGVLAFGGPEEIPPSVFSRCVIAGNWGEWGGGVLCGGQSPRFEHCVIFGNGAERGAGIYMAAGDTPALPTLESSILWGSGGTAIWKDATSDLVATNSCIEGDAVWPGAGNILADPLFCGWGDLADAYVDPAASGPGDGTPGSPFPTLAQAADFSFALAAGSPCVGAGEGGSDIGLGGPTCGSPGVAVRTAHLAAGTYPVDFGFSTGLGAHGSGADQTILQGTVMGLRTGASIKDLKVTGGVWSGVIVCEGDAPEIVRCAIAENQGWKGGGISARGGSPRILATEIRDNSAVSGGALYASGGGSPALIGCVLERNATGRRTCLSDEDSGPGGCICSVGSPVQVENCVISRHSSDEPPVFYADTAWPPMTNCTFVSSLDFSDTLSFKNCIFWNFTTPSIPVERTDHCLATSDPIFVVMPTMDGSTFVEGDYHLAPGSPAIDAGTADGAPGIDIEGNKRPCGAGVDIGAYEAGDCIPSAQNSLGAEPDPIVDGGKALAYAGTLAFPAGGAWELCKARFKNLGEGDAADLVTSAQLWRDDGDGKISQGDTPLGCAGAFAPETQEIILEDIDCGGSSAATYFLVCELEGDGAGAGAVGALGSRPGGHGARLAGLGALRWVDIALASLALGAAALLAAALTRRARLRFEWALAALVLAGGICFSISSGCGGGGGGGGGGPEPPPPVARGLQVQLLELDVREASGQAAAIEGLPSTAWEFEV